MVWAAAQRSGVPLWLVNARLSERSTKGYAKGGALTRAMLACLTGIAAQSEEHALRFRLLGAANVHVTGNIKFDMTLPEDVGQRAAALAKHLTGDAPSDANARPFWVAGSTREGEEVLRLDARRDPPLRLTTIAVIVPRHPARVGSTV